jgi:hypothetical protein
VIALVFGGRTLRKAARGDRSARPRQGRQTCWRRRCVAKALQVSSHLLGNRKPDYRVSILRKMEAVMLQNRALGIGAQHFDAVDKEGAALIGNELSKRIGVAHPVSH